MLCINEIRSSNHNLLRSKFRFSATPWYYWKTRFKYNHFYSNAFSLSFSLLSIQMLEFFIYHLFFPISRFHISFIPLYKFGLETFYCTSIIYFPFLLWPTIMTGRVSTALIYHFNSINLSFRIRIKISFNRKRESRKEHIKSGECSSFSNIFSNSKPFKGQNLFHFLPVIIYRVVYFFQHWLQKWAERSKKIFKYLN